jgi:hypothetical protein
MTRREWCGSLAKLVSPAFPNEAAAALIDMLPALQYLPNELFTAATLTEVAMVKRKQSVPAFDELIGALNHYRKHYIPDPTLRLALPACEPEQRKGPCPEEVAAVTEILTCWRREMAEKRVAAAEAEAQTAERERRPLRDVTAKGEQLAAMRRARGIAA